MFLASMIIGMLSAYITPFNLINPNKAIFSTQSGFKVENNRIWITFLEKVDSLYFVKLGISENYGSTFNYTIIDSVSSNNYLPAPTLLVNSDGSCKVFYIKQNYVIFNYELHAVNYNNGALTENTVISEGIIYPPIVTKAGDNSFLSLKKYDFNTIFPYPDQNYRVIDKDKTKFDYLIEPISKSGQQNLPVFRDMYSPFGTDTSLYENKIFKVNIQGNMASIRILDFSQTHIDTFVVYSHYPDALHPVVLGDSSSYIGEPLGINTITVRDTIWGATQNYDFGNKTIYLPGTVWIQGDISGKMLVYCAKNAFITSNITYQNTPVGQSPNANRTDFFGLVAKGNITLKYKYREPIGDNSYITHYENSQGPDGHVYIYGTLLAMGTQDSEMNYFNRGSFTFEYQHPHGAVMPYRGISQITGQDTLYSFIDLHRNLLNAPGSSNDPLWTYWPNSGQPTHGYPHGNNTYGDYTLANTAPLYETSDWPWYNPVWPEKDGGAIPQNPETDIVWERGTLHFSGSLGQRIRGDLHRSGNGGSNNPDVGIWDFPNVLGPAHYTDGYGSTGYLANSIADKRINYNTLSFFPITFNCYNLVLDNQNTTTQTQLINTSLAISDIKSASSANKLAIAYLDYGDMNMHLRYSSNNGLSFDSLSVPNIEYLGDMKFFQNKLKLLTKTSTVISLYTFDFETHNLSSENIVINDLNGANNAQLICATNNLVLFYQTTFYSKIFSISNPAAPQLLDSLYDTFSNYFAFDMGTNDTLYIISGSNYNYNCDQGNPWASLKLAKAFLNGITPVEEHTVDPVKPFTMNCYPNPFNPVINIDFYLPREDKVELSIYNIKGQKVKGLFNGYLKEGKHHYSFKGKSEENKNLSSGIYFVKISGKKTSHLHKIILLK